MGPHPPLVVHFGNFLGFLFLLQLLEHICGRREGRGKKEGEGREGGISEWNSSSMSVRRDVSFRAKTCASVRMHGCVRFLSCERDAWSRKLKKKKGLLQRHRYGTLPRTLHTQTHTRTYPLRAHTHTRIHPRTQRERERDKRTLCGVEDAVGLRVAHEALLVLLVVVERALEAEVVSAPVRSRVAI